MTVRGQLNGLISWNGWFYGYKALKTRNKYYKSQNVRFDETYGTTEECTEAEYTQAVRKHKEVLGK